MKYKYILIALAIINIVADVCVAQSPNENYVLSRTYRTKAASVRDGESLVYWGSPLKVQTQISYLDGLGKEKRTVAISANPMQRDLSVTMEYNNMFQPVKQYLPIALKPNTETPITQSYYNSTNVGNPTTANYTESIYEPSPLQRVTEVKSPGVSTGVRKRYLVNGSGVQTVIRYYINAEGNLADSGVYPDNSLIITETLDENSKKVEEFTDHNDRVILKRVAGEEDTYYVYNGKGQLRYVLQPQFQVGSAPVGDKLSNYAFQYTYDIRGRMDSKRIPGQGVSTMEYYDGNNMLHYTVDAKQQKFYYNYDALNRQTEMGIVTSQGEKPLLKTKYDNYDGLNETFDNSAYGLTDDDHFIGSPKTDSKKGLITMTSARVLDGGDSWLNTVMFYDRKGRLVQTHRGLYDLGGPSKEVVSYKLDFVGTILEERTEQYTNTIRYRFDKLFVYDHQNRLRRVKHTLSEVNSSGIAEVKKTYKHVANSYNEIGQLEKKLLHKTIPATLSEYTQKIKYQYTPRGWLYSSINDEGKTYKIDLRYNDNGNINSFEWHTQGYGSSFSTISYDASNRLIEAGGGIYKESNITYDKNGNIKTLKREGTVTDNLSYNYKNLTSQKESNRLEGINNSSGNGLGVKNGDSSFQYDANGNMVSDGNKGVNIIYNELNLPSKVEVTSVGHTVNYVYDAAGNKLKMEAPGVTTFYAGTFEYNSNKSLLRVGLEEGQLTKSSSGSYELNYYLRDHLGNVRMVLKEDGEVLQETEYYAFGMPVPKSGSTEINKYLYNGKEKQPETGWLDYGARMYMPEIGRWGTMDPLADEMPDLSPYRYAKNSPMVFIDPVGLLEFKSYEEYEAYAKKNGLEILAASEMGSQGHWLKSDRRDKTGVWDAANNFNLQQVNGQSQYVTISERAAFYGWFSDKIDSKGFETNWPGAAAVVANQMAWMDNFLMKVYVGDDVVKFANAGNKAIFDDVYDNLRDLFNGPALKGKKAENWDSQTLYHEQYEVVQAIYMAQSPATIAKLTSMAKGDDILGVGLTSKLRFKGNLQSPRDRYTHGAGRVTEYYKFQRIYRKAGF